MSTLNFVVNQQISALEVRARVTPYLARSCRSPFQLGSDAPSMSHPFPSMPNNMPGVPDAEMQGVLAKDKEVLGYSKGYHDTRKQSVEVFGKWRTST
jgi:hypothetical protein